MRQENIIIWGMIILLAGCKPATEKEVTENKAVQVKLWEAEIREYKLPVRAAGMLSTSTEMKLGFKTGGIVRQVNIKEGALTDEHYGGVRELVLSDSGLKNLPDKICKLTKRFFLNC